MWFLAFHNYPKQINTPFQKFIFALGVQLLVAALIVWSDLGDGRIGLSTLR